MNGELSNTAEIKTSDWDTILTLRNCSRNDTGEKEFCTTQGAVYVNTQYICSHRPELLTVGVIMGVTVYFKSQGQHTACQISPTAVGVEDHEQAALLGFHANLRPSPTSMHD